jgi:hypothetical protein
MLFYVLIAIAFFGATYIFATHQARIGGSPSLPLKWIGFAGMTAIVFGYAIRQSRALWSSNRFWVLLSIMFAVHVGLGVLVLLSVTAAPLAFFAVLTPVEFAAVAAFLGIAFPET